MEDYVWNMFFHEIKEAMGEVPDYASKIPTHLVDKLWSRARRKGEARLVKATEVIAMDWIDPSEAQKK